jgi:ATP-dependent helicase/DNAse subunit B
MRVIMSAIVHILCGPAGCGKTQRLRERYRASVRDAIGAALWIGPTIRYVEAVRPSLFDGLDSWLAPHLFTFQDWVEEIIRVNDPTAKPLSNVQRRLLADDVVSQLRAEGELSHFHRIIDTRGFGEGVFAFLAELKRNEIRPEQLAKAVAQYTGGKPSGSDVARKAHQCALIYSEYHQRLVRHHLYDLEGRYWHARDLLALGFHRPFDNVRAVFVGGFTELSRVQHEILASLATWVEELWITLPNEPGDERAELFTRPRLTLERLHILRPQVEFLPDRPQPEPNGQPALPTGLAHVERQLFRPLRSVVQAARAEGIRLLEAPGMLGETRMVAREIKSLLASGVAAEDILVTLRELLPYADLIREVFAEYGLPIDVEGTETLIRNPAVATLLRALRLPGEDWPFAGVTALLRSTYFHPDWPEMQGDAAMAQHAEALLRLIGEPHGRAAYLKAVDLWADQPPAGLEDEQADESRRRRTHELALKCRPFLQRFFQVWDEVPARGTLPSMPVRCVASQKPWVSTALPRKTRATPAPWNDSGPSWTSGFGSTGNFRAPNGRATRGSSSTH